MENELLCQQCKCPTNGNFCSNCGQQTKVETIDARYAKKELFQLTGYEKGFVYTFAKLLTKPGKSIRDYLHGNRSSFTKPVTFLFVTSVIYALVSNYFDTDSVYEQRFRQVYGESSVMQVMQWVQENYGYSNILMMIFIAACIKLFFRKHAYNIYEIFVLLCFVMGEGMILLSLQPIFTKYIPNLMMENTLFTAVFVYVSWAIGQFFGGRFRDYLKAFLAYVLGFSLFEITAIVIALLYDSFS
ncbi:DUF3667 domain-containing protein [Flavobacterium sp. MAH-1]|uniref:DUF3667 domain-containing protein n=1 Tax=Flavobacterium agri TaxID=2743471 RepID=A0A7Y8Y4Q2_9FLAO|nr:DUF3667 domain-containing protein [Flavobacterium agri]NUY82545.1 DUF3667 domain-containing protein [Flavobacterium agri]NYA72569.1 DUF3667 domain-containing protein [Flavobacterium agri]